MSEFVTITGLWKNTTKGGQGYYGAKLRPEDCAKLRGLLDSAPAGLYLSLWKNDRKEKDSDPDLRLTGAPLEDRSQPTPDTVDDDLGF